MIKLQDIITIKRELLSRETYSRSPINYSAGMACLLYTSCMSHAKNKFVKASNQGGEPTAERFPKF